MSITKSMKGCLSNMVLMWLDIHGSCNCVQSCDYHNAYMLPTLEINQEVLVLYEMLLYVDKNSYFDTHTHKKKTV